jgi:hypothetical protein
LESPEHLHNVTRRIDVDRTDTEKARPRREPADPDTALRRLAYVALLGCVLIVIYSFRYFNQGFYAIASVGVMAGGAALLAGGLLGFLFGVPFTRDASPSGTEGQNRAPSSTPVGAAQRDRGADDSALSARYRANTSLEQVSDWLTKIIVGVGLVQFRTIIAKLGELSAYLAKGMGGGEQAEALAATALVYFAVCGFVFGFLWARLYLPRWFSDADDVRRLREQVSRLEMQQQADAEALALTLRQLSRSSYDPVAPQDDVSTAIKKASPPVRAQIFERAAAVSANMQALDYDSKNESVISILNGLIASDESHRYHQNHAELSYALKRKQPSDWSSAESAISRAIEIRTTVKEKGWRFYEFHRARCRIAQDPNYLRGVASEPDVVAKILPDLRVASADRKWSKWTADIENVGEWMKLNGVDLQTLRDPAQDESQ